jgi:hypothetical protein
MGQRLTLAVERKMDVVKINDDDDDDEYCTLCFCTAATLHHVRLPTKARPMANTGRQQSLKTSTKKHCIYRRPDSTPAKATSAESQNSPASSEISTLTELESELDDQLEQLEASDVCLAQVMETVAAADNFEVQMILMKMVALAKQRRGETHMPICRQLQQTGTVLYCQVM